MHFEKVTRCKGSDIKMPVRKTKFSAGYDFEVAEDIVIPPLSEMSNDIKRMVEINKSFGKTDRTIFDLRTLNEVNALTKEAEARPTLVPTGMKVYLDEGKYLELSVRSSCPLKYWLILANGVGIIDRDYVDNPDNEGEIFFQMINLSPVPIQLHKGDIIGQGIIKSYDVVENDVASGHREGGLGSTG